MNPRRVFAILVFALGAFAVAPGTAEAGRFSHCEFVDDYKPARGVLKLWTARIKTEWEERHHCLPGAKAPYKMPYRVKVITYRERYTDGTQRTWKCVVAGSEVSLGN